MFARYKIPPIAETQLGKNDKFSSKQLDLNWPLKPERRCRANRLRLPSVTDHSNRHILIATSFHWPDRISRRISLKSEVESSDDDDDDDAEKLVFCGIATRLAQITANL